MKNEEIAQYFGKIYAELRRLEIRVDSFSDKQPDLFTICLVVVLILNVSGVIYLFWRGNF